MNKLEAVNTLLAKIRQRSVGSIEEPLNGDARTALEVLDKASRQVQLRGWSYNTEVDRELTVESSGEVLLPDNTLRVEVSALHSVSGLLPVQRGGRLYDRANSTYTFTSPITLKDLVLELDWDDLPPVAQNHIAAAAAVEMIHRSYGDSEAYRIAQRDEQMALGEALRLYSKDEKVNLLDGPSTTRIRRRR